ncbi:MAG: DNA polymerase I [Nitrospirae bacterium]|nr:DNA polymerase I [Magnetococcales bacterium]HAT49365.1 DNA polymerase I [Alphaproteobacteria bacterium]
MYEHAPPKRLFLIDGHGTIYRAFHGVRGLARRDGFETNAVFGFLKMVQKVVDGHQPPYLAVAFDSREATFRHALDANYKANRKAMPEALVRQIEPIFRLVEAFNIPSFRIPGYEADDILGTLARQGEREGFEVVIVSGDKDLMQLVSPSVKILDTSKDRWIGPQEVEEIWGVPVALLTQAMALIGDTSDNIVGVPKIGIKTAAQLLHEFGSLDALFARVDEVAQTQRRENLKAYQAQARLAHQLVTIDSAVPLEVSLETLARRPVNFEALRAFYEEMEFTSLARQLATSTPGGSLHKVAERGGDPVKPATDYRVITTMEEFLPFVQELARQDRYAVDTETTGIDPVTAALVGLSFSWGGGRGWYLPVAHVPEAALDGQLDREQVLAHLKPILENPKVVKVGQNIKYEYVLMKKYGIHLHGPFMDTMVMSHLLYGVNRRHNLDAIALEELGRTTITFKDVAGSGKNQVTFDRVPLDKAGPYACEDAEVAWEAAIKMEPPLQDWPESWDLHTHVEMPLVSVLGDMENHGVLIDQEALQTISVDLGRRCEVLTEEIHRLAGEPFNVNSTQQLGEILFNKMGIKGGKKTKTGFSTDVTVLTKLAQEGHGLAAQVLEYRSLTKLQSTYTDSLRLLIHPETGRLHTSFNQAVTLTGRLSSSDPNLQNIPIRTVEGRAIRRAFIAPPGWVLVSADYSQVELRLLAHLADVGRLKEAFWADEDIHTATARELFASDGVTVGPEERRMAKTINFGLIYGMSAYGLAKRLEIPNFQAARYMEMYFNRYQGVREYMDQTIQFARHHGYVGTLGGRRCSIREINQSNRNLREIAERTAINAPIQGSAADLIKVAMIRLHHRLLDEGFQSRMILQVHDELVLETPEGEVDAVKEVIRSAMESAMQLSVPLKVDIGVGRNWDEAH